MSTFDETLQKVLHTFAEAVKSANIPSEQALDDAADTVIRVVLVCADIPLTDEECGKTTPPNSEKDKK